MNYNPLEEYGMEEIRERKNYNPFEEEEIEEVEGNRERRDRDEGVLGMELGTDAWEEALKAEAQGLRKIDAEMRLKLERVSDRYMEVWKAIEKCQGERRQRERPGIGPGDEEIRELENEDPEMRRLRLYAQFIVARAKAEKELNRLTAEFEKQQKLIREQKAEAERQKKISEEIIRKFSSDTSMEAIRVLLEEEESGRSKLSPSELAEELKAYLMAAQQQTLELPSHLFKKEARTELDQDFSETEEVIKELRRLAQEEKAAAGREEEVARKYSEWEKRLRETERTDRAYKNEAKRAEQMRLLREADEAEERRKENEELKKREEEMKKEIKKIEMDIAISIQNDKYKQIQSLRNDEELVKLMKNNRFIGLNEDMIISAVDVDRSHEKNTEEQQPLIEALVQEYFPEESEAEQSERFDYMNNYFEKNRGLLQLCHMATFNLLFDANDEIRNNFLAVSNRKRFDFYYNRVNSNPNQAIQLKQMKIPQRIKE
jgi:hypothetical protein